MRSSQLHKMYQSRYTAKNSWWWAERLPETCRLVIPIKLEFCASVGFIYKEPGTHCIGGWVGPRTGLDGWGNSRPQGVWSPDRRARSESLYRLSYPGSLDTAICCPMEELMRNRAHQVSAETRHCFAGWRNIHGSAKNLLLINAYRRNNSYKKGKVNFSVSMPWRQAEVCGHPRSFLFSALHGDEWPNLTLLSLYPKERVSICILL